MSVDIGSKYFSQQLSNYLCIQGVGVGCVCCLGVLGLVSGSTSFKWCTRTM